ncbi:YwqJ-related putative deaminase [Streptosporangium amethystogenes]|uniref:YwqJ-related putative deaminase n=1 Tax=Streptosporangium amethystogenes TaxID=2002 RepID=UPI0004CC08A4|nr:YwqJ-related putative deaminase [Streptosporangium amethystogenes]
MTDQPHVALPTVGDRVPTTGIKEWAFGARTLLDGFFRKMTILNMEKDGVELLMKRLSRLELAIIEGTSEASARAAFIDWVEENDGGGWTYYLTKKAEVDRQEAEAQAKRRHEMIIASAREEAVGLRKKYPGGKGATVGTVIVGLADTTTGKTYTGTSGAYVHADKRHSVMEALLVGVPQVEDWPVNACAEVDAMNKLLIAREITKKSEIQVETLYFHAETWNGKAGKWQARSACKNCDVWLKKIGACRI